jgi:hypothetical protein
MAQKIQDLTPKQRELLLRDSNGNDIPDVLEQGLLPEDMGIDLGLKVDQRNRDMRAYRAKQLVRLVKASKLREIFETRPDLTYDAALELAAQSKIKKWLPYIIIIQLLIIGLAVYLIGAR